VGQKRPASKKKPKKKNLKIKRIEEKNISFFFFF
jgi:hypothetical protein